MYLTGQTNAGRVGWLRARRRATSNEIGQATRSLVDWRQGILNKKPDNGVRGFPRGAPQAPWGFMVRSVSMILLAVCPAILCAYLARSSADWRLFERSGSLVTIAGLLLASRRYFEHRVTELVVAQTRGQAAIEVTESLNRILDARRGLTLSAFGTLIWGWGIYLRWWSFAVLALWLLFVIYRAFYDPVLHHSRGLMLQASQSIHSEGRFAEGPEADEESAEVTFFVTVDTEAS